MKHRKTNNSAGRGASIADLTLTDFRIELADFARGHPQRLNRLPLGLLGDKQVVALKGRHSPIDQPTSNRA